MRKLSKKSALSLSLSACQLPKETPCWAKECLEKTFERQPIHSVKSGEWYDSADACDNVDAILLCYKILLLLLLL